MSRKHLIKIEDLTQNHVQSLSEDDLTKIQGGFILQNVQRTPVKKVEIHIAWGTTQTGL